MHLFAVLHGTTVWPIVGLVLLSASSRLHHVVGVCGVVWPSGRTRSRLLVFCGPAYTYTVGALVAVTSHNYDAFSLAYAEE